jgi:hypothetical protein
MTLQIVLKKCDKISDKISSDITAKGLAVEDGRADKESDGTSAEAGDKKIKAESAISSPESAISSPDNHKITEATDNSPWPLASPIASTISTMATPSPEASPSVVERTTAVTVQEDPNEDSSKTKKSLNPKPLLLVFNPASQPIEGSFVDALSKGAWYSKTFRKRGDPILRNLIKICLKVKFRILNPN